MTFLASSLSHPVPLSSPAPSEIVIESAILEGGRNGSIPVSHRHVRLLSGPLCQHIDNKTIGITVQSICLRIVHLIFAPTSPCSCLRLAEAFRRPLECSNGRALLRRTRPMPMIHISFLHYTVNFVKASRRLPDKRLSSSDERANSSIIAFCSSVAAAIDCTLADDSSEIWIMP